jgi:hypothetical protein
MLHRICCIGGFVCFSLSSLVAQNALPTALDIGQTYERVVVVCPLIGKGTYADPRRPEIVPASLKHDAKDREKAIGLDVVMAYAWVPSDDGKSAIVEIVVRDPAAMKEFLREAGKVAAVTLFERGKQTPAALDTELRKVKKDFNRRYLRAVAP